MSATDVRPRTGGARPGGRPGGPTSAPLASVPGEPSPARLHAAAAAAVLAVALGLSPVIDGGAWVFDTVLVVATVALAGALTARARRRPLVVTAAQWAALLVALAVVHAPAQAVWGLLPGPAAWERGLQLLGEGVEVVQRQAAPVEGGPGMRLLASSGAGVLAIVVQSFAVAARRPALAGLPLLAVHAVAVTFAPGGLGAGWFLLALAGFLLLVVVCGRPRSWGVVVAPRSPQPSAGPARAPQAAAVSVVAAVLLALALPAATDLRGRPEWLTGSGSGPGGSTFINPLLDLRDDLGERGDAVVLTYATDLARPQPLRIVTVDSFTGDVWEPGRVEDATGVADGRDMPVAGGTAPGTPVTEHVTTITIEGLRQQWLPLPYPATSVAVEGAEAGDWLVDPDSLNVIAAGDRRTDEGQRYEVRHQQVAPEDAQLATAQAARPDVVERFGRPPEGLPEVVATTAREVVAGATTPYEQALALQDWFRSDGGFRYTLDAPSAQTSSALADFVVEKEGYCVHFASTMAVMARTLGIPARVAVGFLPGTRTAEGWEVTASDAHAWPELYFEGAGWTRFEPTPGVRSGVAPVWTVEDVASSPVPEPQPGDAPATPTEQAPRDDRATGDAPAAGSAGESAATSPLVGWGAAALAGAGALALVPRLARAAASRRRWGRAADDAARAEAAWADLVEQVGDLGVALPASATPRQVGARLRAILDAGSWEGPEPAGGAERLQRLVGAVEGARYGAAAPARPVAAAGSRRAPGGGAAVLDRPVARVAPAQDLRADALALAADVARHVAPRAVRRWRWWPDSGVGVVTGAVRGAVRRPVARVRRARGAAPRD